MLRMVNRHLPSSNTPVHNKRLTTYCKLAPQQSIGISMIRFCIGNHQYKCGFCHGKGYLQCLKCDANNSDECDVCDNGVYVCSFCYGSGISHTIF